MDLMAIIPFAMYFLLVIGIGIYSVRFSSKGVSEFFLGGRQMSRFVVALSAVVSGRSAWLLLGFTGLAYMIGFSALWSAVGYIIVEFLLFIYYAPRIRTFTEEHDCITLPDFYAVRFKDESGNLRALIVAIFMIFMVTYVAAQFVAGGKAFFAYFGISPILGLIITAGIVLVYTILGGFLAVSLTDVLQAIFMIAVLIGLPLLGIYSIGGWEKIVSVIAEHSQIDKTGEVLSKIPGKLLDPFSISLIGAAGALGIGLGSPGSPHIIVRFMSIKDSSQFRWTAVVGTIWNVFMAAGALYIGIIGRAYFPLLEDLPGHDPENVYITLAGELMHPAFVGVLLASIFAAIMSTADSQLLVAASSIVRDIYEKILRKDSPIEQRKLASMSRWVVTILVILAVVLGIWVQDLVFWFVLFAWAGLGAAIGSTSILAIFWKRTTKAGVFAGLITGTLVVFIWKTVSFLNGFIYELIPGFILATLATIIVSLITNKEK